MPQHLTPPPLVSAQVCSSPAETAAAVELAAAATGARAELEPADGTAIPTPARMRTGSDRRTRAQAATFSWERCAQETLESLTRAWSERRR